jgi:recombination protein RecR
MRSAGPEIDRLIDLLAKLPGLGPRSARRAALQLLKRPDQLLRPLAAALAAAGDKVRPCTVCGNLDTQDPCGVCRAQGREEGLVCVVAEVADLWAMERSGAYRGRYHVLGGVLSALDGVRPEDLRIGSLVARCQSGDVKEVILALDATVDGQTTAHVVADAVAATGVPVTRLAQGVPVGGSLELLDDGTILAALKSRKAL